MKTHCKWGHAFSGKNLIISSRGTKVCRKCGLDRMKKYLNTPKKKASEYERKHKNLEYYRAYSKKRTQEGKSIVSVKKWEEKNQEKLKAHSLLNQELKKGNLLKGICKICGENRVDGHHPDYKKPLEVIWLCRQHHKDLHNGRIIIN